MVRTSDHGPWTLLASIACTRQYRRGKYTMNPDVTLNVYDGAVKLQYSMMLYDSSKFVLPPA